MAANKTGSIWFCVPAFKKACAFPVKTPPKSVDSIHTNIRDFYHKYIVQHFKNKRSFLSIMSISVKRIASELIQNNMR